MLGLDEKHFREIWGLKNQPILIESSRPQGLGLDLKRRRVLLDKQEDKNKGNYFRHKKKQNNLRWKRRYSTNEMLQVLDDT